MGALAFLLAAALGEAVRRRVPRTALATLLVSLVITGVTAVDTTATALGGLGLMAVIAASLLAWRRLGSADAAPLAAGLVVGSIATSALCAYQLVVTDAARATGGFWHANILGAVAALTTLALSSAAANARAHPLRVQYAVGALASGAAVVMSLSRGALVATAVGLLVLVVLGGGAAASADGVVRRRRTVLAASAAVLLAVAGPLVMGRFAEAGIGLGDSGRDLIWQVTFELSRERPFLGHGFGVWAERVSQHEPAVNTFATRHAHSLYLQLLFDVGTLGVATLLGAIGFGATAYLRRRPHLRATTIALLAASALSNLAEPLLYWWQYVLALVVSLVVASPGPHSRGVPSEGTQATNPG